MKASSAVERRSAAATAARYVALVACAVVFLGPLAWLLSMSLRTAAAALGRQWIPNPVRWANYAVVFSFQPFANQLLNSAYIMALVCLGTLVVSSLAGFALARINFPGRGAILILVLSSLFIPAETTIIPLYRDVIALHWTDTHIPLILFPICGTVGVVGTFVMRQAFLTLPQEVIEAARVDGASWPRILIRIALPMVRPSLAAVVVLTALSSWNQYLQPLVFLRSRQHFTVPLGLSQYSDQYTGPMYNIQAAATTLSILPVIAIFLLAQRQFIAGLTEGSVKA
ncbi:carbohydrate ABC transporter permease [Rugosimonospora acidiphila]|uniref:Carbohydrate ABC transporter permease n=1 Tax=Rugosimonospora acidiphila TaxID=556531 RepID=A0ABP9RKU0_9ACTN